MWSSLLQMLQRSWVPSRCTHGRETRLTSAVRWWLTPEPLWFGSETASRCPLPTPPTWRSTTRQNSATWRSAIFTLIHTDMQRCRETKRFWQDVSHLSGISGTLSLCSSSCSCSADKAIRNNYKWDELIPKQIFGKAFLVLSFCIQWLYRLTNGNLLATH